MSRLVRFVAVAVALAILSGTGCKKNSAPEPPAVSGPGVAKPGAELTFGFTSVDPDGDDVWYMISWGDGAPAEWSPGRPSGERYNETHTYPDSGDYFVRAKAKDNDGAESDWSDSSRVAVGFLPPDTPFRPSGPTSCTTKAAYTYKARASHPLDDSVSLQFFWGDALGAWGPMVASNEFFETTHAFDTLGTYKIAVKAKDARGLESGWSDSLVVIVDTLQGPSGYAPRNLVLTAATDVTVGLAWSAPPDSTPSGYVIFFRRTGTSQFDSVGATQSLSFIHNPDGRTGQYQVAAVYDTVRYSSSEIPATTPIAANLMRIPELNGSGETGYGWSRSTGRVTMYDMTVPDSADKVDLYVTDFAQGFAGPVYSVANPFRAPQDPGGIVPAGDWQITKFSYLDSLATEDSVLPRYLESRYDDSRAIDSLPMLIACHTEDGYFALVKATDVDTITGTADIQTWFQLVKDLRLIEH
jgi:hypothetical protein